MKILSLSLVAGLLAVSHTTAVAQPSFYAEAGVSYLALRDARFERTMNPLRTWGGRSEAAPFIAGGMSFSEHFGVRLSYHYVDEIDAVAELPSMPGGPVTTPVVTWGHYRDEVHLVGLSPELRWAAGSKLRFTLAPTLNWVASRGDVWYAAPNVTMLPGPARRHSKEDFTFGGSVGLTWPLTDRAAVSVGYQYANLEPSFGRTAHIVSGAFRWNF